MEAAALSATFKMKRVGRKWLLPTITQRVIQGQRLAARELGLGFGTPNRRLIERLALDLAPRLAAAAESTTPGVIDVLRRSIAVGVTTSQGATRNLNNTRLNQEATLSLARGSVKVDNPKTAALRLMTDLGLNGGDSVLYLSGRRMGALSYASTVSRTRGAQAVNQAKANEYLGNGYAFIETSSHAGVDPDDICSVLQGQVWALAPNALGIPVLPAEYGLPPWHPNCVHTFGVWTPGLNGGRKAVAAIKEAHKAVADDLAAFDGEIHI